MTDNRAPGKRPALTTRHKIFKVQYAKTYMEQDMQHFIFSDETRATLDGPDRMGHDVEPPPSMSLKITGRQQLSSSTVLLILLLYLDLDKNR